MERCKHRKTETIFHFKAETIADLLAFCIWLDISFIFIES